jgi:hypothetical protein
MTPAGYFRRLLRGEPTNENRATNARTRRTAPMQGPVGVFRFTKNANVRGTKRRRSASRSDSRSKSRSGKKKRSNSLSL